VLVFLNGQECPFYFSTTGISTCRQTGLPVGLHGQAVTFSNGQECPFYFCTTGISTCRQTGLPVGLFPPIPNHNSPLTNKKPDNNHRAGKLLFCTFAKKNENVILSLSKYDIYFATLRQACLTAVRLRVTRF